ncbi:MAG: Eco57I restriction-modification methylase domain-containing protein [Ilumatobacteraceae bacterium]
MSDGHGHAYRQLSLDVGLEVSAAVHEVDHSAEHGEVFTRRWVVDLILDLAGYTVDRDLCSFVAVEPSCGAGAFLVPMTERLIESCQRHGRPLSDVRTALRAFDLLPVNAELAQKAVGKALADGGLPHTEAHLIAHECVRCGDFLLASHDELAADFVLGNPPYIRLEDVPAQRREAYRRLCPTMRGRSDIFVGFIETGLRLLRPGGALGFIVADRWMHNQYGSNLRRFVTDHFAVEAIVSMHDVDAFEDPVSAYPAVTIIRRGAQSTALVATATKDFGEEQSAALLSFSTSRRKSISNSSMTAVKLPTWFGSETSWPSGNPANLALVADLERRLPPLEDPSTGTRVGIGVATGVDSVYLTKNAGLVEQDRLLPLLMTRDTTAGSANWSGTYLVNPWRDGRLVDLTDYPKLKKYFTSHASAIRARHVAQHNPSRWYRTIDRVEPGLQGRDKLVIPDLKAYLQPVLDRGQTYPHHGLYFITSDKWDLEVLGGLLLSELAELFVATYCVKMRGGTYRFQAQYLRRIRVPEISSVGKNDRAELARAFEARDRDRASAVARRLYGVD